jgi:hypothetical protein
MLIWVYEIFSEVCQLAPTFSSFSQLAIALSVVIPDVDF